MAIDHYVLLRSIRVEISIDGLGPEPQGSVSEPLRLELVFGYEPLHLLFGNLQQCGDFFLCKDFGHARI